MRVGVPQEEEVEDPTYRFPSIQDEYHAGITTTTREEIEQMIGTEIPEQEQTPSTSQGMDPRPGGLVPSVIKTEPRGGREAYLKNDGPQSEKAPAVARDWR